MRLPRRSALLACALAAALCGCDSMGPSLKDSAYAMERSHAGLARKEITLADGTHIVYLESGSGAPLVLVHGFGADKDNFARASRWLTRVDLGGNSMGGGIVMSYAAQYPQEADSLWLLDAAGIAEAPPGELAKIIASTGQNPLMIAKESDFPACTANQDLERKAFARIATDSVSAAIKGLATPTSIVWGDEDRALSVGTVPILERLLPNAQAVVMPHVGHAPMLERPQQSAEDYLRFRARLAPVAAR